MNNKIKILLCGLFFLLLAIISFRCVFGPDMVFSASDVNVGGLAHRKNYGMDLFSGYFGVGPVFGSTNYAYSLFNFMVLLVPIHLFSDLFYGFILCVGSFSMVWFLRIWNRSWAASVFGAIIGFWLNSILLATGGHVYKMEVLAFTVLGLCLIEKSIRASTIKSTIGFALLAGTTIGVMLIEQQDVALLSGLFMGSYTLFRLIQSYGKKVQYWGAVLLPMALVALLLSGSILLKSYGDNITNAAQVQETDDGGSAKWDYITQWGMVPSEWPDFVALGRSGWSSQNPEGPYWGKVGQSAEWETTGKGFRNFTLTTHYFGIIPFLFFVYGTVFGFRERKTQQGAMILFWSLASGVVLLLSYGKYSFLYRLFYQLPLVGNIRDQSKFIDLFQLSLGIVAAYGLDQLLNVGKGKRATKIFWISSISITGLMTLAGLRFLLSPAGQKATFIKMGYENYADIMVKNMSNAWFHGAFFALMASVLIFWVWKGLKGAKWVGLGFVLLVAVDSVLLTTHYFRAENISDLRKGNIVTQFIQEHQGDERVFFLDQSGIYNRWLAVDRAFHQLNLFNIWQMNRMPAEYKEFLSTVGRNQVRLWELSAVKYVAVPASVWPQFAKNPAWATQFKQVLNYQVPTPQGMRPDMLLEFSGSIPRVAVMHGWSIQPIEDQCGILQNPAHNPHTTTLLEPASGMVSKPGTKPDTPVDQVKCTNRDVTISLTTDDSSIIRFAQRYQPGWAVWVDGEKAPLLKVDYLCMGVHVSPGKHVVQFKCPRTKKAGFAVTILLLSLVGGWVLIKKGNETTC